MLATVDDVAAPVTVPPSHPSSSAADWPPTLAAPGSLLGQLQRGLGSGARAALAAGRAAAPEVLAAFATDPRSDRQIDARSDYYARLVLALDIEIEAVHELLRSHAERTPTRVLDRTPLALDVLARLVQVGNAEAVQGLRQEAITGRYWLDAIDALVYDANGHPLPEWESNTLGLAESVDARGDEWLSGAGASSRNGRDEPWRTWIPKYSGIRSAFAANDGAGSSPTKAAAASELGMLSTEALLELEGHASPQAVTAELATRTSETDRDAMLSTACDSRCGMRASAIRALAKQQRAELVPILKTLDERTTPRDVVGAMIGSFAALPAWLTHEISTEWLVAGCDRHRMRAAASALGNQGPGSRPGVVITALARELDAGVDADEYVITSLAESLGRAPKSGPYPILNRAFNEMQYSYGRSLVAGAIAATDPDFPTGLALDSLWDCEPATRALSASRVALHVPGAATRVVALAADPFEDPNVRAAAAR